MRTLGDGTKIKELSDYTQEELSKMDGGTIADLLHDYYKYNSKPYTLMDSFKEYKFKHRMNNW